MFGLCQMVQLRGVPAAIKTGCDITNLQVRVTDRAM